LGTELAPALLIVSRQPASGDQISGTMIATHSELDDHEQAWSAEQCAPLSAKHQSQQFGPTPSGVLVGDQVFAE
jgi:hypothetical protein